jgi:hypothetical protein
VGPRGSERPLSGLFLSILHADSVSSYDATRLGRAKGVKGEAGLNIYYKALASDVNSTNERECPDRDRPWEWWLAISRNRYPILFKMAIDYLSCPCTSCDCERAFSLARRTITDDRKGLRSETIEATQLLKNWLRRDVGKSLLRDLGKHVQKLDKSCDSEVVASMLFSSICSTSTQDDTPN